MRCAVQKRLKVVESRKEKIASIFVYIPKGCYCDALHKKKRLKEVKSRNAKRSKIGLL